MIITLLILNTVILVAGGVYFFKIKFSEITNLNNRLSVLQEQYDKIDILNSSINILNVNLNSLSREFEQIELLNNNLNVLNRQFDQVIALNNNLKSLKHEFDQIELLNENLTTLNKQFNQIILLNNNLESLEKEFAQLNALKENLEILNNRFNQIILLNNNLDSLQKEFEEIRVLKDNIEILNTQFAQIKSLYLKFETLSRQYEPIEKLSGSLEKILDKHDTPITTLNTNLKNLESQLEDSLRASSHQWENAIKAEKDRKKHLKLLETASKQFPYRKDFIVQIRKILEPIAIKKGNLFAQREALIRLREHANRFATHCTVQNFEYAQQFKDSVSDAMKMLLDNIDELKTENIENVIEQMSKTLDKLKKDPSNEKHLKEIEELDRKVNQSFLKSNPTLSKKYKTTSDELITLLKSRDHDNSRLYLKSSNEVALKNANRVIETVKKDSNFIANIMSSSKYDEKELEELVLLLTSNNPRELLPSTLRYIQMAENELFNKLNPEGKEIFTRLMIENTYKNNGLDI